jgi:hypothetical protein
LEQYREAAGDLDSALNLDPRMAQAVYLRGVTKLKMGEATGGAADIEAAKTMSPTVVEEMSQLGVQP